MSFRDRLLHSLSVWRIARNQRKEAQSFPNQETAFAFQPSLICAFSANLSIIHFSPRLMEGTKASNGRLDFGKMGYGYPFLSFFLCFLCFPSSIIVFCIYFTFSLIDASITGEDARFELHAATTSSLVAIVTTRPRYYFFLISLLCFSVQLPHLDLGDLYFPFIFCIGAC